MPCLTRGTQCVRSAVAAWPAIWWHLWLTRCRPPRFSGWRGRWTTAPTGLTHTEHANLRRHRDVSFKTDFFFSEYTAVKRGNRINSFSRPTSSALIVTDIAGGYSCSLCAKTALRPGQVAGFRKSIYILCKLYKGKTSVHPEL